jgi:hypothetical protein
MRRTTKTGRRSGRRSGRCQPFAGEFCCPSRQVSALLRRRRRRLSCGFVQLVLWAKDVPKARPRRRCHKSLVILPYCHVQNCSAIPAGSLSAEELRRCRIIQPGYVPKARPRRRCHKSLVILPYRHVQNCSAILAGSLSAEELRRCRIIQPGFNPLTDPSLMTVPKWRAGTVG